MMHMKIPDFLPRPLYLNKVIPFIDKPLIKVFTGQRRSGKSYVMLQTIDYIRKQFPACDLMYLKKEDPGFNEINNDTTLWNWVQLKKQEGVKCFVFIDEVQEITHFEKAL